MLWFMSSIDGHVIGVVTLPNDKYHKKDLYNAVSVNVDSY